MSDRARAGYGRARLAELGRASRRDPLLLSLLFLASCEGATLTNGLTVDAVFSYTGCAAYGSDATALFTAMHADDGIAFRATDTAYQHISAAASGLTYRQAAGPVLLSPAVIDVDPLAKSVPQGDSTQFTVTFPRPGEYVIACNEYCGLVHHNMVGKLVVK